MLSVARFYAKHVTDGRAFLDRRKAESTAWIVRACVDRRVTYWLCRRDAEGIELLDPLTDVKTIRTAPTRHPKEWHRAMQKSPGYFSAA